MVALILILIAIGGMLAFDLMAIQFGVDSRDGIGDDHVGHSRTAAL